MKIAVTGVGGGVGQSVLKSLANSDYEVIGLDGELLGTGLYVTNTAYHIPYANHPDYIPRLFEICENEGITLLFPGLDAELPPLSKNREKFASIGTTLVVSHPDVVAVSDNKQLTYDILTKAGVEVPFTQSIEDFSPAEERFPAIIKPREGGARSKNVFLARNQQEYELVLEKIGNRNTEYIVMDYIAGDEYTCGTVNLDNSCKGTIVMRRVLRDGDTYKCFVEHNDAIEETVSKVVNALKPFGACNVQLRLKDGIPYVFEINARCSGTTAARTLSGFNEPLMIADYLLKGIEPKFEIKKRTIFRYWKELVVDDSEIDRISKQGTRKGGNTSKEL